MSFLVGMCVGALLSGVFLYLLWGVIWDVLREIVYGHRSR